MKKTKQQIVKDIKIVKKGRLNEASFLNLNVLFLQNEYSDGSLSAVYRNEFIIRKGIDSVAIAPFFSKDNKNYMGIRKGIRPAAFFRKNHPLCIQDINENIYLYEAIAGSLEKSDKGIEGLKKRAVLEVKEETGFIVSFNDLITLGSGFYSSHGQSSEKIHLFAVRIDPLKRGVPDGDGSILESDSLPVEFFQLEEIFNMCFDGVIEDPKIEIMAFRLFNILKLIR